MPKLVRSVRHESNRSPPPTRPGFMREQATALWKICLIQSGSCSCTVRGTEIRTQLQYYHQFMSELRMSFRGQETDHDAIVAVLRSIRGEALVEHLPLCHEQAQSAAPRGPRRTLSAQMGGSCPRSSRRPT